MLSMFQPDEQILLSDGTPSILHGRDLLVTVPMSGLVDFADMQEKALLLVRSDWKPTDAHVVEARQRAQAFVDNIRPTDTVFMFMTGRGTLAMRCGFVIIRDKFVVECYMTAIS
jgi:hypothetical protein